MFDGVIVTELNWFVKGYFEKYRKLVVHSGVGPDFSEFIRFVTITNRSMHRMQKLYSIKTVLSRLIEYSSMEGSNYERDRIR